MTEVLKTKDYDMFKPLEGNRPINRSRVIELAGEMEVKNLLHVNPIIVDGEYRVVDGQHRLAAAQMLGLPIYYIVDENIESLDVIKLNTHRANWTQVDYIKYYADAGKPDYEYLQDILRKYLPVCMLPGPLLLVAREFSRKLQGRSFSLNIKNGRLDIAYKEKLEGFLELTIPFCKNMCSLIIKSKKKIPARLMFKPAYLAALIACYKHMTRSQYEELLACLDRDYTMLRQEATVAAVLESFEASYNRKKTINKFDFSDLRD